MWWRLFQDLQSYLGFSLVCVCKCGERKCGALMNIAFCISAQHSKQERIQTNDTKGNQK